MSGGEVVVSEVKVQVGMKGVRMKGRLLKQKKPWGCETRATVHMDIVHSGRSQEAEGNC